MAATSILQVGTKVQLFGITNQNHTSEVFGDILYYNGSGTLLNGTAYPNMQQAGIRDIVSRKYSMNQAGATALCIFHDQQLEVDITCIPEGATITAGDPVDAILSCKIGAAGSYCTLENFPVMASFGVSDIWNSTHWLYEGGAELTAVADDRWGFRFTLRRYLAAGTALQKQNAR